MGIYIYIYTYIHTYVYVCIYRYMYIRKDKLISDILLFLPVLANQQEVT